MSVPVYDWPRHHARRIPAAPAMIDLATGRRLDWAAFDARIDGVAAGLAARGVRAGDRVGVLARNATDIFELQFACWRIGAVFLPLNWRLTAPELAQILADAAPVLVFAGPEFRDTAAQAACGGTPLLPFDAGAPGPYEDMARSGVAPPPRGPLTHDDLAAILYTSGTTGRAKGAMITHGMAFWNAVNLGLPSEVDRATVHLTVLPLFHTAGLNAYGNVVVHAGGVNVVMRDFDPAAMLSALSDRALGITHTYMVPSGYQFMMDHPDFATADLTGLRIAGTGGSPCARALLEGWAARGVALQQGYGMTETSPTVMLIDAARAVDKIGSAGLPALHTEVRLVGPDGRDIAGAGETGEIRVRGPNVTPGYWNAPERTAEAFADGWFCTGDAARRDEDGFYYIVDRWKDIYISGGENVSPAEVEDALQAHAAVAQVAVIGVPDDRWGEVGLAVVVLHPGAACDADALRAWCRARLAGYKIPRHVRFADTLPRTASGKVRKHALRQEHGR